jgi:hypothetical protein
VTTKRYRKRGAVAVEELLSIAAVMGCFAVPVAVAARTAGSRIAGEMDRTHETLIDPKKANSNANASSSEGSNVVPNANANEE